MEIVYNNELLYNEMPKKKAGRPRKYTNEEVRERYSEYHLKYYHEKVKNTIYKCEFCGKEIISSGFILLANAWHKEN
jgi:hypothetical protein